MLLTLIEKVNNTQSNKVLLGEMDSDLDWSYRIDVELPDVETTYRASNVALNQVI